MLPLRLGLEGGGGGIVGESKKLSLPSLSQCNGGVERKKRQSKRERDFRVRTVLTRLKYTIIDHNKIKKQRQISVSLTLITNIPQLQVGFEFMNRPASHCS